MSSLRLSKLAAIGATAAMVVAAAACSSSSSSGSSSGSAAGESLTTLRINTVSPYISTDYVDLLADHEGFFAKNGIKAQFVPSPDPVTPLIAGDFDVSNIGANGLIAVAQGRPLKFLVSPTSHPLVALMVKKGSPLAAKAHQWPAAVTQLQGMTVGTTSASGLIQQLATYMCTVAGLKPGQNVKVIPSGNSANLVAGLEKGSYDAALVPDPSFEKLEAQGEGVSILNIYSGEGPSNGALNIPWLTEAVTASFYDAHPQAMVGYQKAIQETLDWAHNPANKSAMITYLAQKTGNPASIISSTIGTFTSALATSAEYPESKWNQAVTMMRSNGVIKANLSYSQYVAPWKGES